MGFNCTPSDLVEYVLRKLAFSGNNGLSLNELWQVCSEKLVTPVDEFEKQIIWQWLFHSHMGHNNLFIWQNDKQVHTGKNYSEFLGGLINEESVRIFPTSENQWKYLMGQDYSKKLNSQLGDYPFQLLCEIGKAGPKGIFASDLSKVTNQDPRSLTVRLKKLEDLNLINKINVYNLVNKQHTNLCVHKCFQNAEIDFSLLEFSDDIKYSRDAERLRSLIMQKIKQAPNELRSLGDLKHELSLGNNRSIAKFFRGIVESLCKKGYLEKVRVQASDDDPSNLIYCVKLLRDMPNANDMNNDNITDILNQNDDNDKMDQDENSENKNSVIVPKLNDFFPISTQLYHNICTLRDASSMDICRILGGNSGLRPLVRFLETITTYVIDNNKKKLIKSYEDPYEGLVISRTYDFEGKFKFYRYSGETNSEITDNTLSNLAMKEPRSSQELSQLNKKLFTSLGKIPQGSLLSNKRKPKEPTPPRRTNKKRKTTMPNKKKTEDSAHDIPDDVKKNFETNELARLVKVELGAKQITVNPPENFQKEKKRITNPQNASNASIKSIKRREELLKIIKESGGVTFTSAHLRRLLDKRLGNSTLTDMKTIVRDIVMLVHENVIEARDIKTMRTGQNITRKLLILLDPALKPSEAKIEETQRICETDDNKVPITPGTDRRIIRADVALYSTPPAKGRLDGLHSSTIDSKNRKARVKNEPSEDKQKNKSKKSDKKKRAMQDIFTNIDKTQNPLTALVGSRFRGRKIPRKKDSGTGNETTTQRKSRTSPLTETEMIKLFKLVVISRSFKKMIDFEHLSNFFENMDGKELKQKWTSTRRKIGGLNVVSKSMDLFEEFVDRQIESGNIGLVHFQEPMDFSYFLDLWDASAWSSSDELTNDLYYHLKDNYEYYSLSRTDEVPPLLLEQLEKNSMKQKEVIISHLSFYESSVKLIIVDEVVEQIKTSIKAICATDETNFSSDVVRNILSTYGNEKVQEVITQMMREREVSFTGMEGANKSFSLTEKFESALLPLNSVPQIFHEARIFFESSVELFSQSKAVLLSQGIKSGHMIPLLNGISNNSMNLIHVIKPFKFNGYESRLIDKSKVDCDLITYGEVDFGKIKQIPVPTGKASSRIWLDLDGNINRDVWIRIIVSLLWYIAFRPGVQKHFLYHKFNSVLSLADLNLVLEWLKESNCLQEGDFNDYRVYDAWFTIIG